MLHVQERASKAQPGHGMGWQAAIREIDGGNNFFIPGRRCFLTLINSRRPFVAIGPVASPPSATGLSRLCKTGDTG